MSSTKRTVLASSQNNDNSKKTKLNDAAADKTTKKKSPFDIYVETRKAWLDANKEYEGAMLIQGISQEGAESEEDENEVEDTSKYTAEQMNSLRCIMLNKSRVQELKNMEKLILGEQADSPFMMFNTSFSYVVLDSWNLVKRAMARKSISKKLDILIAYTYTLHQHDYWMNDNEGGMEVLVKGLSAAWRTLLKNSDDKIGWDTEYTKPGVLTLLKQFQSGINSVESYYGLGKFKYM